MSFGVVGMVVVTDLEADAEELAQEVLAVVRRHAPDFDGATMVMRPSTGGKYVSLTCTINATSKAQLDTLYRELSGHPLVKIVL